ncbi:MAG: hypothetical protein OIF51_00025 [Cellvibrionaceae bacterium]|nr:hypothetical protein [Cellvibrionaceae bacterium]
MRRISENIFITELSKLNGGTDKLTSEIPDEVAGVYAFFGHYDLPSKDDSACNSEYILEKISQPHMLSRSSRVAPLYNVTISSERSLSEKKRGLLTETVSQQPYKDIFQQVFNNSFIFQTPLYVGKSINIKKRIKEHLEGDTNLKNDLLESGISISGCSVLFIITDDEPNIDKIDEQSKNAELIEDCLSRLFCPGFTRRYG